MKLITETNLNISVLKEDTSSGGPKKYYIQGVFMESNVKNRNGRVYPDNVLGREVQRYNDQYVSQNRALGELGHPEGPTVNLERVSHMISDLRMEGNNVVGKSTILGTPYGDIVRNLIDEGVKLGVSSRGMGSLKEVNGYQQVQEDFMLAAVDIVADPSAPNAFVNGIMEGKEWVWDNGVLKQVTVENYKNVITKTSSRNLEKTKIKIFEDFMSKLSKL
jgi:hypothetical protein